MHSNLSVIGIAGTNGSGKDSLGQVLADKHGYLFISLTDMLRDELRHQGKPTNRANMRELSAVWRRESGLGVLVDKANQQYQAQKSRYKGLVMASLRNPGEADTVHEFGGTVVWVDADPKIRYERLTSRGREDDPVSFEQFLHDEKAEQLPSGDEATLSTLAVKEKADVFLENNGNTLESLEKIVENQLT